MKIKLLWKFIPVFIFYNDYKFDMGGKNRIIYVKIKNKYKDDGGLLCHELTHSKQFYRLSLKSWLYHFSAKWRLKSELECYAKQIHYYYRHGNLDTEYFLYRFSHLICFNYRIYDKTVAEIKMLLIKEIEKYE